MNGVCFHEARHAVAALWMSDGRTVDLVRVDRPEHDVAGCTLYSLSRATNGADVVIRLVGWMGDPDLEREWPPLWPEARGERLENLGKLITELGLSEAQYEEACVIAHRVNRDAAFQHHVGLVASALAHAPVLDAESVEILREAAGIPAGQAAAA
jgi:hypothetical protein